MHTSTSLTQLRSSDSTLYWVAKTQEMLLVVLYYQHNQHHEDEDDPQNIYINLCFHILNIILLKKDKC